MVRFFRSCAIFMTCFHIICFLPLLIISEDSEGTSMTNPMVQWNKNSTDVTVDYYKVLIDPGEEDCYFQHVNRAATFHLSFQVVRGGNEMARFTIRNPAGRIVHPYQQKLFGEYQDRPSVDGYYSVCIDNQYSGSAAKSVNLYIAVVRYDLSEKKYTEEIEKLNMTQFMENLTTSTATIEENLYSVLQHQHHSLDLALRESILSQKNNNNVMLWPIIQIVAITATTAFRVYFVRKLFDNKTEGQEKTSKI